MGRSPAVFFVSSALVGCTAPAPAHLVTPSEPVVSREAEPQADVPASSAGALVPGWQPVEDPAPPRGAPPPRRVAGNFLTVNDPPEVVSPFSGRRMRTHVEGTLTAGSRRIWSGPPVPIYVPLVEDRMELFLLDPVADGEFVALYRDPYGSSSCTLGGVTNCLFAAALFRKDGRPAWVRDLNDFMSRGDHLEVQDMRYDDGVLYFNEACASYSSNASGQCSSLLAIDPVANRVLWRSAPLTSNSEFMVVNSRYLLTGYGFFREPNHLFLLRRRDGVTVSQAKIPSHHSIMARVDNSSFRIWLGVSGVVSVEIRGVDSDAATLVVKRVRLASAGAHDVPLLLSTSFRESSKISG